MSINVIVWLFVECEYHWVEMSCNLKDTINICVNKCNVMTFKK